MQPAYRWVVAATGLCILLRSRPGGLEPIELCLVAICQRGVLFQREEETGLQNVPGLLLEICEQDSSSTICETVSSGVASFGTNDDDDRVSCAQLRKTELLSRRIKSRFSRSALYERCQCAGCAQLLIALMC